MIIPHINFKYDSDISNRYAFAFYHLLRLELSIVDVSENTQKLEWRYMRAFRIRNSLKDGDC